MNSIGVDFKLKNIQIDDKNCKLQIVNENYIILYTFIFSGIQLVKKDLELLLRVTIKVHKLL